jgi:hypothetical protein
MAYSLLKHQSCGLGSVKSPPSPDSVADSPPTRISGTNPIPILNTKTPALAVGTALGILEAVGPKDAMKIGTKTAAIKILVVEDNPGDLYLIRASLSLGEIPKHLSVVTDGEEALRFLSRSGKYKDASR